MSEPDIKMDIQIGEHASYYHAKTWCYNCQQSISRFIKKGIERDKARVSCDNCGCFNKMSGGK